MSMTITNKVKRNIESNITKKFIIHCKMIERRKYNNFMPMYKLLN